MHDAVDWKIIDENPLLKVKTQKSSVKVNEFVPREVVDKLMKKANPVWQVILGLSRYGGLRTPSETLSLRWEDIDWEMNRMSIPEPKVEHHEGRGIRSRPIFPELRPILDEAFEIFGDKSEYVVAAPQYRAAANTAMGWKNSNLRTEMTRLLRRAGVSDWPAVATCRQTVDALLAPPSTAWQRMATMSRRWRDEGLSPRLFHPRKSMMLQVLYLVRRNHASCS